MDRYAPAMPSVDPCLLVILGASGDLTSRKLLPALYERHVAGDLPAETRVLGVSRRPKPDRTWREELAKAVESRVEGFDQARWAELATRISYEAADAAKPESWQAIAARIAAETPGGACGNVLFFLAVAPELYAPIVAAIGTSGLVSTERRGCRDESERGWRRIVVEKPFGTDEASAKTLNRSLSAVFDEEEIYRIDHYLGKESVQGLLALRFANGIFEPIWNERYVDHVQITAAESLGVEDRVAFYDRTGAIRDMIQSHLLQILAFVAMEPPSVFAADRIRAERRNILEAIQVPEARDLPRAAALGQYGPGPDGVGYVATEGVAPGSTTETFAAMRIRFDNWRWAGTPFYLRTGKRLAAKRTEVVVQFKAPPTDLFRTLAQVESAPDASAGRRADADRLVIEIAPRSRIRLRFLGRAPGASFALHPIEMEADAGGRGGAAEPEAYGPLLVDAMRGDQSLFKDRDEVEASWAAVEPLLGEESVMLRRGIADNYAPGSWGPAAASELLAHDGRAWHD
jgi:glucose-6-phosphate 1-dehydrogenase